MNRASASSSAGGKSANAGGGGRDAAPTVQALLRGLDAAFPWRNAQPDEPVGLLVGEREAPVQRVLLALDCHADIVREAVQRDAQAVLALLPPWRDGPADLTSRTRQGRLALQLARENVALIVGGSVWDALPGGISDLAMEHFKCRKVRPLMPSTAAARSRVSVLVAADELPGVLTALAKAGVAPDHVAVHAVGRGGPQGTPHADAAEPSATEGTPATPDDSLQKDAAASGDEAVASNDEKPKTADESPDLKSNSAAPAAPAASPAGFRVEATIYEEHRKTVVTAISGALPDQDARVDHVGLDNTEKSLGIGRVGEVPARVVAKRIATDLSRLLRPVTLRHYGSPSEKLKRLAFCLRADADTVQQAVNYGATCLVVGEITYEGVQLAQETGLVVIEPGLIRLANWSLNNLQPKLAAAIPGVEILRSTYKSAYDG